MFDVTHLEAFSGSRSQIEKTIEVIFLGITFVLAFVLSGTIFCSMLRPFGLRNPSNLFSFFLVATSLCLTLLHTPFAMATVVMDQWPFAVGWCLTSGLLINVLSMASNFFIVTIALHRYYLIVKPLKVTISIHQARKMVGFVWFTSFINAIPPIFGWSAYRYIPGKAFCSVDWEDGGAGLVYSYYLVTVSFVIPFVILVYIYRGIYLKTKRQRIITENNTLQGFNSGYVSDDPYKDSTIAQRLMNLFRPRARRRSQYSVSSPSSTFSSETPAAVAITPASATSLESYSISGKDKEVARRKRTLTQSLKRPSSVYEQRTIQSALILLATFIVNLLPFYIVGLWSGISQRSPSIVLDFIVTWLFISMAAVNPILYGFMNRQIRRVVWQSAIGRLLCRACKRWNEDLNVRGFYSVNGKELTSDGRSDTVTQRRVWGNSSLRGPNMSSFNRHVSVEI